MESRIDSKQYVRPHALHHAVCSLIGVDRAVRCGPIIHQSLHAIKIVTQPLIILDRQELMSTDCRQLDDPEL